MKAILLENFGDADVLQFSDQVPEPQCRPTDLIIRVHAAGVNRADILQRKGAFGRADYGDSSLMGLEIAGEIVAMGDAVTGFQIGDRVMGIVGGGGYAELARIDYRMAMPIPSHVDYIQAAAIPEVFVTAHEALFHLANLQSTETVLIHAAGSGVGSACIQLAHDLGAKVIATTSQGKIERVRDLGADHVIDYKEKDFAEEIRSLTSDQGVDVIIDFIGAPYLERNVMSMRNGGRLVQVGLLGGKADEAKIPLNIVLYRYLKIMGTVMKSRSQEEKQAMVHRFAKQWLPHFQSGALKPIIDSTYHLSEAAEAHRRMESNANFGKIVLVIE